MSISAEELRKLLDYDPETGVFTRRRSGLKAGCANADGYIHTPVGKRYFKAHRLAWLYVHGEWPERSLDHINGDRGDNRIANLRLATPSQNGGNRKRNANSSSGVKGVCWHKRSQKWLAQIQVNGRRKHLGVFTDLSAATEAYRKAAVENFGEFAR